jgi:hypothetical protein
MNKKSTLYGVLFSCFMAVDRGVTFSFSFAGLGPMRLADAQTGRPFYVAFQIIGIIFIIY